MNAVVGYVALFVALFVGSAALFEEASAKPPSPAPAVAEFTEAEIELYEAMYAATPVALNDMLAWSDAEKVAMVTRALATVMQPESLATWKPGYIEWLRVVHNLTDVEIVGEFYKACAQRALWFAEVVFAQMDKPG